VTRLNFFFQISEKDFCPGGPPFSEHPRRRAIFKKIQNFGVDARLRGDPEKGGPSKQKSFFRIFEISEIFECALNAQKMCTYKCAFQSKTIRLFLEKEQDCHYQT
jgi:hypothetical protein